MKKLDIEFNVEKQRLCGLLNLTYNPNEDPAVLIIGGGANIPLKQGYYPAWQEEMLNRGVSSLSFDFRGVGSSDIKLPETSLRTRLTDAHHATDKLNESAKGPLYVARISMGAPIAIHLANLIGAEGFILISPAAYTEEVWGVNFGPEFSQVIRQEGSWEGSPSFAALEQFKGKVLLAYGEQDDVIPT